MSGLETQKFSEWKKEKAKDSYLWKLTRFPIISEVTDFVGNSIQGIVNNTREGIDTILNANKKRERITEDAKHEFSKVGGNVAQLPKYQMPLKVQKLFGGKSVTGEVKVDSDGRLLNAVYLDEAPCKITTVEKDKNGNEQMISFEKGEKINRVLEPGVTYVTRRRRFLSYLIARTGGRKHTGIIGGFGILMKGLKRVTKLAGGLGGFAVGALGVGAALNAGLMALGAPNFMSTVAAAALGGTLTIPGVAAAAVVGIGGLYAGIKLGKFLWKLIPKDRPNLLYAARTESQDLSKESIKPLLSKQTGRTLAQHQLDAKSGTIVPQEGDFVTHIEMKAKDFGIKTLKVVKGREKMVDGFYDSTGTWYEGKRIVPAGTKIPHGTTWKHNGTMPSATEYKDVESFTKKTLPVGTLENSIRIDVEGGAKLPAMLKLRQAIALPFDYFDKEHQVQRRAGSLSPAESIVDVRLIPKGTILPAGSEISHEIVSEGADNVNTTDITEIPSAGLVLPHATIIRRDISLGDKGVLIPANTQEQIQLYGQPGIGINDLPGRMEEHDGVSYKLFQPANGVLTAGSRYPSGTILPARAQLTEHGKTGDLPIRTRLRSDLECASSMDLMSIANNAGIMVGRVRDNAGNQVEIDNFRLRISDAIPSHLNTLPTFRDPSNGSIIYTGHEIPAGTEIPATQLERSWRGRQKSIRLPKEFVIPGGSIAYDATRPVIAGPEMAGQGVNAAMAYIRALDPQAHVIGQGVAPNNYRNWLLQRPQVTQILGAIAGTPYEERVMAAIEAKIVDIVRADLANFTNTISGVAYNAAPIQNAAGQHDYMDRMMTEYNNRLNVAIRQISDYGIQDQITQAAHRSMINKIGANLNNMITVQLRARFGVGGPQNVALMAAGAAGRARQQWLRRQLEVTNIVGITMPQLINTRLSNEIITEGRRIQDAMNTRLDQEITDLCA